MVVEVKFSDEDGFILANLTGISTISDSVSAFMRIFSYSSKKNTAKVIVDCREIDNSMPLEDITRVSEKFNNIQDDYHEKNHNKLTFAFLLNDKIIELEDLNDQLHRGNDSDAYIGSDLNAAIDWILSK